MSDAPNDEDRPQEPAEVPAVAPPFRVVESSDLLAGEKTVVIRHEAELYRLTVTRNGKLLLQK